MSAATPNARTFAWLTAGVVAFTIYGSLVPFQFHTRTLDDAVTRFQQAVEHTGVHSKSDFVANGLLGVPLGFCLLGVLRLDQPPSFPRSFLAACIAWPWCIVFAAVVEFAQLFFHGRMASGSDILAQSLGSAFGMLLFLLVGERFVNRFRGLWASDRIGGTAGRMLLLYAALLGLTMWLPFDLTLSPKELYDKNVRGDSRLVLVPFAEITKQGGPDPVKKRTAWLILVGLNFPAGLLAGCIERSPWNRSTGIGRVALFGVLLACTLEAGQLIVTSRTCSVTDVLLGSLAFLAGWAVIRSVRGWNSLEMRLLLAQAWVGVLLAINWLPFDFVPSLMTPRLDEVNWIPFAAAYEKNYLHSLEEAASKTLLYAPLGAIVGRKTVALVVGVAIAAFIEAGQLTLPSKFPSLTDLIFGGVGAWLGAVVVGRLRAPNPNHVRFKVT